MSLSQERITRLLVELTLPQTEVLRQLGYGQVLVLGRDNRASWQLRRQARLTAPPRRTLRKLAALELVHLPTTRPGYVRLTRDGQGLCCYL